jgi:aminoglycoside phosphotransferase (APT) family kinase protein
MSSRPDRSPPSVAEQLARVLTRRRGLPVEIENLRPLSGGASSQTWSFDAVSSGEREALIVQLAAGHGQFVAALEKTRQARAQATAFELGILTPEVLWILEASDDLGEGYVSRRVEGETLGKRIVGEPRFAAARSMMAQQCGVILAGIHSLPREAFGFLPDVGPLQMVERLGQVHRSYNDRSAVFELALRWLVRHVPSTVRRAVLHGDFRTGNLLVSAQGINGVLDWELSHIGDPMEDLAWLCLEAWRFGVRDQPVGGFGRREVLYQSYRQAGGVEIDEAALRFWEIFGALQWGVICQFLSFQYLRGEVDNVERVAIGRRVSETELDLLNLLEVS